MSEAPKRILVIDDDPSFLSVIQRGLERAGYEVAVSPYLATAVGDAISGDYDLITLDLNMPGIDGQEVAQLLRVRGVETPVVIISAFIDDGVRKSLEASGIRHFLSKPFPMSVLTDTVEQALSSSGG